jgi:hypothetical protein
MRNGRRWPLRRSGVRGERCTGVQQVTEHHTLLLLAAVAALIFVAGVL